MSVAISKKFENNLGVVLEQYKSILSLKNIDVKFLDDIEYIECVKDILEHPEFLKTKNFKHHQSSIFDHVLKVSFLAYKYHVKEGGITARLHVVGFFMISSYMIGVMAMTLDDLQKIFMAFVIQKWL